jgi:hypothetical protein
VKLAELAYFAFVSMVKKTGSESPGTLATPGEQAPAEPLELARLQAEVAKQRVRIAKDELKRARKRLKEAKREAKRARKQAVVARKVWKKARRRAADGKALDTGAGGGETTERANRAQPRSGAPQKAAPRGTRRHRPRKPVDSRRGNRRAEIPPHRTRTGH